MHDIIETIVCTKKGVFTQAGAPWPTPSGHINNFYTDDGEQYIGTLHRVRLGPESWQWQAPQAATQAPLF